MKKIKVLALVAALAMAGSCREDFLDERPVTTLATPDAITSEANLDVAVNGLYGLMQTNNITVNGATILQNNYGALVPTLNELLGDNAFVAFKNSNRFSGTRLQDLTYFNKDNADFSSLWSSLYRLIANSNFVLDSQAKISANANTDNLYAQAKTVRAMSYLTLISLFSENYGAGNQDLGVPMPLKFDPSAQLPRAKVGEVYAQILKDLKDAEAKIGTGNGNTKLNKNAVELLLSRYYLAVKDYQNANLYSQKVLDDSKSKLLTADDAPTFFDVIGESNSETLFQVEYSAKDSPGANDGITATWSSDGRYKQNFATQAFFNRLNSTDVRRMTWYNNTGYVTTMQDSPKPVDVRKYLVTDRDVVVLRKTEAVFNQLEALYYTNQASALTKLNTWMKAYRDPSYNYAGTGADLLKEILFQKDVEFFLEGFRYTDLKRNNLGVNNPQTGVIISASALQMKAFPIPRAEMNANPNMTQFPGY